MASELDSDKSCGICLEESMKDPLHLPCDHSFCSGCLNQWRSKYGLIDEDTKRRCPICRARIPPSKEMVSQLASYRARKQKLEEEMDTSSDRYRHISILLQTLENEIGQDWDGVTVLEDGSEPSVIMPDYIFKAAMLGNIKTILKWIYADQTEDRVNAISSVETLGSPILRLAAFSSHLDLMSLLLQLGANVDYRDIRGGTAIGILVRGEFRTRERAFRLLLSWGASFFPGELSSKEVCISSALRSGNRRFAELLESELGGRRCEIVDLPSRPELNGKTCVVEEYRKGRDEYIVTLESGRKESLTISGANLKRRDRTPDDCGYCVEFKNGRAVRHEFDSSEECREFLTMVDERRRPAVTEDDEARADRAAAELLAELDLEDAAVKQQPRCIDKGRSPGKRRAGGKKCKRK
mmetsp:Transcript_20210/g.47493  ORF Transcript_20210/g.47493 Transcript_20210/m.47493 type:complete len:410 (+) Transcript_20210:364-1593(+)